MTLLKLDTHGATTFQIRLASTLVASNYQEWILPGEHLAREIEVCRREFNLADY